MKLRKGKQAVETFTVRFWGVRGSYPTTDQHTRDFGGNTLVAVADDGCGMDRDGLINAMRYGSKRPAKGESGAAAGFGQAFHHILNFLLPCDCNNLASQTAGSPPPSCYTSNWRDFEPAIPHTRIRSY